MNATARPTESPCLADEVHIRDLTIGDCFDRNVFDEGGMLLAPTGTTITEEFLDKLMDRGVRRVKLSIMRKLPTRSASKPKQAAPPPTQTTPNKPTSTRDLDKMIDTGSLGVELETKPRTDLPRLPLHNLREEAEAGCATYQAAIERYAEMSADVLRGKPNVKAATDLIGGFMKMIRLDTSLGALVMQMKSDKDEYLYQHGLNVALLSMTIGQWMGLDREMIYHAGLGALFADIGMLRIPRSIRFAQRALTKAEWLEVEQHPIHTANALEQVRSIHYSSLLTAYQSHERCDGSGYPRRRRGGSIHPLARLVAVADTYAAMTATRPHRSHSVLPYESMVTILRERVRLDRATARAALNCMSLFPIGSDVILSDGTRARVLRSNGPAHTRPVVIPVDEHGTETDHEIDLAKEETLKVISVPDPRRKNSGVKREAPQDSAA